MRSKRIICTILTVAVLAGVVCVSADSSGSEANIDRLVNETAAYVYSNTPAPSVNSIGGEWAVLGLARAGYAVSEQYYDQYYQRVADTVVKCGGVLHDKKYTEFSRVIIALSSIGKDARNVAGYDLVSFLGDYDKTIWQGNNGPIFALIALDSANYPMPTYTGSGMAATRQKYIDLILEEQHEDGGWSLGKTDFPATDPDMTGMALQALAKYRYISKVDEAIRRALDCASDMIKNRHLLDMQTTSSESIAQILLALCELGVDYRDERFMDGNTNLLDALLKFRGPNGSFTHDYSGTGVNQMSAEQGLYTLVAVQRFLEGKNSLYRMGDALDLSGNPVVSSGSGTSAVTTLEADGTAVSVLQVGETEIKLKCGSNGDYTVSSTRDIACAVLLKNGDSYTAVKVTTLNGAHTVSISDGAEVILAVKGDLDNSGRVNALEARKALKASTTPTSLNAYQTAVADLNADGRVSALEARKMLKASASPSSMEW
ncbi:MAG: hypothetical protein IKE62_00910 [Oscillospiraceae bacterium]|nr:hypothetical protein [Oscillospiraceae bacterium]